MNPFIPEKIFGERRTPYLILTTHILTLRQVKSLLILLGIDPTCCITGSFLFRRALSVMILCGARMTMKPLAFAWRGIRERNSTLEALIRMGARNGGMRNICELLLNVVMLNRPKMLIGLGQKGKRYG
jgi:hypothetical protein